VDFELKLFLECLPLLLRGAIVTVELTLISGAIGLVLGIAGGLARIAKNPVIHGLASFYVTLLRGIPLLVTLTFLYYGLPSVGIQLESFTVAIIGLSITNGAYVTEIMRAGIQSIEPGQMRAARSLGMSYPRAMRRIILPQAIRRVLPPLTNETITLLKNTALVSTIALTDLLKGGVEIMTWKANTFSPFAGVALFYLAMTLPMQGLNQYVERRFRMR
jgi:His/Glu/Gln/Arg/opine family amino acid ABC transporter permease subunit